MHRIVLAFLIAASFLMVKVALAQTMGGGTEATSSTSQTPSQETQMPPQETGVLQSPPNYPMIDQSGRVYPQENLDPFGLSTLGGSTDFGERKGVGTLGVKIKQKTNAEVNKPKEKKETGGTAAQGGTESGLEANTAAAGTEETTQINPSEPMEPLSTSLNKSSGLYTWKDKNGVVHVTNNMGSVPAEYREQMINKAENGKNKEASESPQEDEQQ